MTPAPAPNSLVTSTVVAEMAVVRIHNFRLDTILGVHERERQQKQSVFVDLEFEYDAARAIAADDLAQAVDYEALAKRIQEKAGATEFRLVETLAAFILDVVLGEALVRRATVRVRKPGAIPAAETVEMELSATRD